MTAELYPQDGRPGGRRALRLVKDGETATQTRSTIYERLFKRPLDLVVASGLLVVAAPIIGGVALAIRIRMGRRVIFRQERVGLDGQPFAITKFRTMRHDRRHDRGSFMGQDRRLTHKTVSDPRHTKLGAFLRKYALDELPQLLTVLRGEMSMVGPRPELVAVAQKHDILHHSRHSVRPGITGPWQLSAARDENIADNLHYDEAYVAKVTLRGDLGYMLKTLGLFRRPTGS